MKSSSSAPPTKIGRKGDPRMHRAVGARIADPKLNLYDALKIGGFDYPKDDPNAVDAENVTLAQRKNQLCRRIRTILCPCTNEHLRADEYCRNHDDTAWSDPGMTDRTNANQQSSEYLCTGESSGSDCGSAATVKRQRKRNKAAENQRNVRVKYDFPKSAVTNNPMMVCNSNTHCTIASNHPSSQQEQHIRYAHGSKVIVPYDHQASEYSQLAITSLSQSAASMGMTLDQLALALSTGNNTLVSGFPPKRQPMQSRQDYAITLCQSESRSIIHRAMTIAGYSPEIANDDESAMYLQIAIAMWNYEGQRLREHMEKLKAKGRTPILHQPVGCTPHIDFVVNNFVECYHDAQLADDLGTQDVNHHNHVLDDDVEAKLYYKNDSKFDNDAWNLDFMENDELLNQLFRNEPQVEATTEV